MCYESCKRLGMNNEVLKINCIGENVTVFELKRGLSADKSKRILQTYYIYCLSVSDKIMMSSI